jgi:hypothetical protein
VGASLSMLLARFSSLTLIASNLPFTPSNLPLIPVSDRYKSNYRYEDANNNRQCTLSRKMLYIGLKLPDGLFQTQSSVTQSCNC